MLGYSDDEDDDGEELDEEEEAAPPTKRGKLRGARAEEEDELDEEEDEEEWGTSKRDYYGADEMETEQDALDEEAEAKRLQQKQLASMSAADYGFDEEEWAGEEAKEVTDTSGSKTVTEALPRLAISKGMTPTERLKLLKSRFPEFEPLSKEFLELQSILTELREAGVDGERASQHTYKDGPASNLRIKERAASAYLAVLAMYFALLTSAAADLEQESESALATSVRDHPVMDSLLSTRELWNNVKDLEDDDEDDYDMDEEADMLEEPLETAAVEVEKPQRKRVRKTKSQKAAAAAAREAEERRAQRMGQAEADLADLDDLLAVAPKNAKKSKMNGVNATAADEDSDFGETELSEKALADKAAKRKSLRFYTSQITQKSNKRGAAGRSAGGDDDIPYRERLKDRQARLNAEAARKGQRGAAGADLGGESDEDDYNQARAVRDAADDHVGDDDYYQYIANKSASKKAGKEALAAARKEAILNGGRVVETETLDQDGKRKLSYAIEKNKGLTPNRRKDIRNPRVKKRKKFEERKKKLGSMRAVYKGGEGRGGYGGEMTGIKSNLVKSRKL